MAQELKEVVESVLEGLCTLAVAGRALVECWAERDLARAKQGLKVIRQIADQMDLDIQTLEAVRDQERAGDAH